MSLTNELQGKEINYQKGFRDGMIEGSSKAVDMMTKNMQLSTEPLKIKLDKIDSKIFLKDYIKLSDVMGVKKLIAKAIKLSMDYIEMYQSDGENQSAELHENILNILQDLKKQLESKGG